GDALELLDQFILPALRRISHQGVLKPEGGDVPLAVDLHIVVVIVALLQEADAGPLALLTTFEGSEQVPV
ncbi:DUF3847 domain-containing protein, partial [Dysosmobacter welbionis]